MSRSFLMLLMVAVVSLQACKGRGDTSPFPVADTLAEPCDTIPRISVTFIMGRDNSAYNQYYTLASHYYRLNPDERTEVVVDSLTALSQVLDWLRLHPADNGLPYGLVNLVTHGNEFIDLQMTVTPDGQRTSVESLRQAMADSLFLPPDSTVIDRHTLIYLHGCAVGQNQSLLDALAQAFGNRAAVKASKHFEYYAYLSANRNPQSIRHYFARTWYAFYHPDSDYNEAALVQQLRRRYPADTTHWREGLRRRLQENPSQLYHYSFVVPCLWDEVYASPADMPLVNTRSRRSQWVAGNADFRSLLARTHIPQDYFQVKFYRKTYLISDDSLALGLHVRARAGVVCLIQPLVAEDSAGNPFTPFCPQPNDTAVFAFSQNAHILLPSSFQYILGLPGSPVPPFL